MHPYSSREEWSSSSIYFSSAFYFFFFLFWRPWQPFYWVRSIVSSVQSIFQACLLIPAILWLSILKLLLRCILLCYLHTKPSTLLPSSPRIAFIATIKGFMLSFHACRTSKLICLPCDVIFITLITQCLVLELRLQLLIFRTVLLRGLFLQLMVLTPGSLVKWIYFYFLCSLSNLSFI